VDINNTIPTRQSYFVCRKLLHTTGFGKISDSGRLTIYWNAVKLIAVVCLADLPLSIFIVKIDNGRLAMAAKNVPTVASLQDSRKTLELDT